MQYQTVSPSLFCHVIRTRIETFLQYNYTPEEICNLILHGGGFLKTGSKEIVSQNCERTVRLAQNAGMSPRTTLMGPNFSVSLLSSHTR